MSRIREALRKTHQDDDGLATIELAIWAPVLVALITLGIYAGRSGHAHEEIQHAAEQAARTASLDRDATTAAQDATTSATNEVNGAGMKCKPNTLTVTPQLAGFTAAPGLPASITVTVSCQLKISDLTFPGIPGNNLITATATSPLDLYRER